MIEIVVLVLVFFVLLAIGVPVAWSIGFRACVPL